MKKMYGTIIIGAGVVATYSAYTYINENEVVCFFEDEEYNNNKVKK